MHWKSIGKMIEKLRQKSCCPRKKKRPRRKKRRCPKKLEDEKPGNLLVSAVRKVIKEEQSDSNIGSRLTTKKVSRIS